MKKSTKQKRRLDSRRKASGGARLRLCKPTSQTSAKLQPDPLWTLSRRGVLTQEQIQAAWDIRQAFEVITVPVRLRKAALEKIDCGAKEYVETSQVLRLLKRYNDWIDELTRYRLQAGPVLDVVVESISCREVDRRRGVRKGATRALLIEALNLYCKVAGWPGSEQ